MSLDGNLPPTPAHFAPLIAEMSARLWPGKSGIRQIEREKMIVLSEALKTMGFKADVQYCMVNIESTTISGLKARLPLFGLLLEDGAVFSYELELFPSWDKVIDQYINTCTDFTVKSFTVGSVGSCSSSLMKSLDEDARKRVMDMMPMVKELALGLSGAQLERDTALVTKSKSRLRL